ncbi:hypothetical protein [Streptomyces sp. NPDC047042]|uniref:AAA family ATPase n=1 Tax=Streptomyces sp. NPDC047042 TaxID=3154807 RepID=UPI00340DA713
MKDIGYGEGYQYDPDTPGGFSGADYFPDGMDRETFYRPTSNGYEEHIRRRLERWSSLRRQRREAEN